MKPKISNFINNANEGKSRFAVFNGSPKGNELSISMQYFYYIQKNFTAHEFDIININEYVKKIENDRAILDQLLNRISLCDGLIWVTPVYYCLVPSPMKRFFEIIFESKKIEVFKDKYSTAITSSFHYFDHTAHNYLHAISEDLGMKFMPGYSADALELTKKACRHSLKIFFSDFLGTINNKEFLPKRFLPIIPGNNIYNPPDIKEEPKTDKKKVVIISDHEPDSNLSRMIDSYKSCSKNEIKIVNLHNVSIKGPCVACLHCFLEGVCSYKDDIRSIYENEIFPADGVIFAGTIKDRFLSSRFKLFTDRSNYTGCMPILRGKSTAYLISGPLRQEPNILQILESIYVFVSGTVRAGIVTDEYDSDTVYKLIRVLADNMDRKLNADVEFPGNFLDIAGNKMLRDFIYENRWICKMDHRRFKKQKLYDYPQKKYIVRILNFIGAGIFITPLIYRKFILKNREIGILMLKTIVKKSKD